MSGTRLGKLWDFYHKGEAQNSKHYKSYCHGCVAVKLALEPAEDSPEQRFQHGQIKSLIRIKSHVRYQIMHSLRGRRKDARHQGCHDCPPSQGPREELQKCE